jgi:putative zinc finger protein
MVCVEVREQLTEHALATMSPEERAFVGRHLEWCAGCRKEAEELQAAAAWVGLSAEQADPPAALEERVVGAIAAAAQTRAPWRRRLRVLTVATAAALLLAVIGVGWGAAMFARVQTSRQQTVAAEQRANELARRMQQLLNQFLDRRPQAGPREQIRRATLAPTPGHEGGAGSVIFTSPFQEDWALVIIGGLPHRGLPYHVALEHTRGRVVDVGTVRKLSTDGSARVFRTYKKSLKGFSHVSVKDRNGAVVLSGDLGGSPVRVQS